MPADTRPECADCGLHVNGLVCSRCLCCERCCRCDDRDRLRDAEDE